MFYELHFDVNRCAQCFACEVACKSAHSLRPHAQDKPGSTGPRYREVMTTYECDANCPIQYVSMAWHALRGGGMHGRLPRQGHIPRPRVRCRARGFEQVPWLPLLLVACEFGAPQFGADGLMQKCDMCIDRLRDGLKPACVENCCGGAISIGPAGEPERGVRQQAAATHVSLVPGDA